MDAAKPVSEKLFVAEVLIWTPFLKILYPVTATLSVEAFQVRLIWEADTALAARKPGFEGAVVSVAAAEVVKVLSVETVKFPEESRDFTR